MSKGRPRRTIILFELFKIEIRVNGSISLSVAQNQSPRADAPVAIMRLKAYSVISFQKRDLVPKASGGVGASFDCIKLYLNKNTVIVFFLLKLSMNKINLNIFHDYFIIKTFIFDYLTTFKRCFPLKSSSLKMWNRSVLLVLKSKWRGLLDGY